MTLEEYDVIVIGAGHAGCEAALIASKMGARTLLVTINLFTIAQMSCNPAIGGLAKGHLVKEIDALGGQMGVVADETGIQFRMLNTSKGPSVWSLRTQNDRAEYSLRMKHYVENQENLYIRQHDVKELVIKNDKVTGIVTEVGTVIKAHSVILCNGTFLNGLIHVGLKNIQGGRSGEIASVGLSDQLLNLGFEVARLKTGTPPRIDGRTINYASTILQPGDENPVPFSYQHENITTEQLPCYLTKTTSKTHEILQQGLDRSPLYTGVIKGVGPRYCPSIEDKIVRFSDKDSHQLFLEPEGRDTYEYYLNGFATSLAEETQIEAVHSIPGLENAKLTRLGYAIEYDFFPPSQLKSTLETKAVENLYFAGQINGTSGYEEAAAQGLMAGINAVLKNRGEGPFVLPRSEAYIGVLIDDLVTKTVTEPYRMFTSRAEYRLLLRQDNADLRLMEYGYKFGTIPEHIYEDVQQRKKEIDDTIHLFKSFRPSVNDVNTILEKAGSSTLLQVEPFDKLLKRPELSLSHFFGFDSHPVFNEQTRFWDKVREQVEIEVKYEGFLQRQKNLVQKMDDLENMIIPDGFDYNCLNSVSNEGREKLSSIRPRTLGQASRILGVSPSDIAVLMVFLSRKRKK